MTTRLAACHCPLPYRAIVPEQHIDTCPVLGPDVRTSHDEPALQMTISLTSGTAQLESQITDLAARLHYALEELDWIANNHECCTIDAAKEAATEALKVCDVARGFKG